MYKDKFRRRVDAPFAAEDSDQKIHRNQGRFPEDVKEKQVERQENADHPGFQNQHEQQVFLETVPDRRPRGERTRGARNVVRQTGIKADSVHAEMIVDSVTEPGAVFDELRPGLAAVETDGEHERKNEGREARRPGRDQQPPPFLRRDENEENRPAEREKRDQAQQRHVHVKTAELPGR